MTKRHIIYETMEQVRYPKRMTEQSALCGVLTPTGEQVCLDDPMWHNSLARLGLVCQRCYKKALTLVTVEDGVPTVKPGLVVPTGGKK